MASDFINIRTQLLDTRSVYNIHIYVISKGEEMAFGLFEKDEYSPTKWPDRAQGTIQYYGADNRWTRNEGKIWMNGKTMATVHGFYTGDWVTVQIDFPSKKIVFYRNGTVEYELDKEAGFLEGECYFWTYVDVRNDTLFIEQTPNLELIQFEAAEMYGVECDESGDEESEIELDDEEREAFKQWFLQRLQQMHAQRDQENDSNSESEDDAL